MEKDCIDPEKRKEKVVDFPTERKMVVLFNSKQKHNTNMKSR